MRTTLASLVLLAALATSHAQTPVVPKSFAGAKQPQVAVRARGDDVFVTFGKGDSIYVARSTNNANSFEAPQLVGKLQKLALGMRRGPRIVSIGSNIAVSAISHEDGNLYCWVSKDGGLHWSKGARVNDTSGAAREGLHAMAASMLDDLAVAWLDLRTGKTELRGSISHDSGSTWSTNFLIYRSPDGHICECCHPSLVFNGPDDNLFAMWRNCLNGSRDMYMALLYPAADFNISERNNDEIEKLGTRSWPLNACPMDGGGMACKSRDFPITVWRREGKIILARNSKDETVISESGSQPCIAVAGDNYWIAYQNGDKLMSVREHGRPSVLAKRGKYPAIAGSEFGTSPIVVWETGDDNAPIVAKKL